MKPMKLSSWTFNSVFMTLLFHLLSQQAQKCLQTLFLYKFTQAQTSFHRSKSSLIECLSFLYSYVSWDINLGTELFKLGLRTQQTKKCLQSQP